MSVWLSRSNLLSFYDKHQTLRHLSWPAALTSPLDPSPALLAASLLLVFFRGLLQVVTSVVRLQFLACNRGDVGNSGENLMRTIPALAKPGPSLHRSFFFAE